MMNNKRAFTLIELLVVIAIIAILAAILFPVFAQAKEAAKKTADLSNQKNISTAYMLYEGDSDDTFPRHEYKAPNRNNNGWKMPITWRDSLMPYIKNGNKQQGTTGISLATDGIFESPAKPGVRNGYAANRIITPGRCYWKPAGNYWACDSGDDGERWPGEVIYPSVSATALDAPAQIAVTWTQGINPDWGAGGDYAESGWWWFGGAQWPPVMSGPASGEQWDADTNVSPNWSMPRYRYTKGLNTGFADGHAKFIKKTAFNWCRYVAVKGLTTDLNENWDWMFDPGNPCAAFAR